MSDVEHLARQRRELEKIIIQQSRLKKLADGLMTIPQLKVERYGGEILPKDEPVLVLATHQNSHDAHAVCYAYFEETDLPLSMVEKAEFEKFPLVNGYLRALGALPFVRDSDNRGVDRRQAESVIDRLTAGGSVGLMGEGTRRHGGIIGPLKTGFDFMARRAGVDIVTVGVYGDSPRSDILPKALWPFIPRPMTVYFGSRTDPAEVPKKERTDFYRNRLQDDYDTALALHYGRPLPEN